MATYDKNIRTNGFYLKIAELLYHQHLLGKVPAISQPELTKQLGLSKQAFYRHETYSRERTALWFNLLGITKVRGSNNRCSYILDVDTYKNFILGAR